MLLTFPSSSGNLIAAFIPAALPRENIGYEGPPSATACRQPGVAARTTVCASAMILISFIIGEKKGNSK